MPPLKKNKPHPRHGATPQQATRYQRERDAKNRLHALEQRLKQQYETKIADLETAVAVLRREHEQHGAKQQAMFQALPDAETRHAIRMVIEMPFNVVCLAGYTEYMLALTVWFDVMEKRLPKLEFDDLVTRLSASGKKDPA